MEAMIQAFNGINSLRQHIRDRSRIHGIITDGGEAPNVVPAHTAARFLVRAEEDAYLEELRERVLNCFVAASLASGARLEYRWGVRYSAMRNNLSLAEVFSRNMEALGRKMQPPQLEAVLSTDMGNVSMVVPCIHPWVAIAPKEIMVHSPQFAAASSSKEGHAGLVDAAKALAMTLVDLVAKPEVLPRIREEYLQPDRG